MSRFVFLRKILMAHINKIYRFIENTSKMSFTEKNKTFTYIFYFILLYIRRAISTERNAKKTLIEKKHTIS